MENQTFQNQYPFNMQITLPNSTGVLVLGIISIVICICYGIFGLGCGITALILSNKAKMIYEADPEAYTLASYNNLKAGRICAIVGTCLSSLFVIFIIIYFIAVGAMISSMPWGELNNY